MTLARQTALLGVLLATAAGPAALGRQTQAPSEAPQLPRPKPAQTAATAPLTPAERTHNSIAVIPALPFNSTTVVIDPAHGGADNGSRINDNIVEKDVTLALAFRLRSLLAARGFNVVLTRDNDGAKSPNPPFAALTLDDRAGLANHERAAACLLLHATSSGTGVHLYSSEIEPAPGEITPQPWLTGQAAWVPQSHQLTARINDALLRSRVPVVSGAASVRPLDSLTCPALVIELAPNTDDDATINDEAYQTRIAQAITGALVFWKDTARPPTHLSPAAPSPTEALP